jgi:uncharacterized membrane protein YsdA (DUF1294 family)
MVAWMVLGVAIALLAFLTFVLCVLDKRAAQRGKRRVSESVLLGLAFAGGSPGLLLGMILARHKTRKASFLAALAMILLLQAAVVVWLL